ncbi:MAG: hypothetical protein KatS3mg024_2536 [Armatimonadota bacterium]|nr:MAG: hypothetical protein KatS3mg024_2536 [Armatimonadota bacterium]
MSDVPGKQKTWRRWPALMLFFLMLNVPTSYQAVKAILLLAVLGGVLVAALRDRRLQLAPFVRIWAAVMVTVGLFYVLYGLLLGAPGALRMSTVYALWPAVYILLVAGAASPDLIRSLTRVLVLSTGAIALYALSFVLYSAGLLPAALYLPLDLGQRIGFYSGHVEFNLYSLSTLLFAVPFLVAAVLTWPRGREAPVRRVWLWVVVSGALLVVLLSGRRALWLVSGLSPILALTLRFAQPGKIRRLSRNTLIASVCGVAATLALIYLYARTAYGVDLGVLAAEFAAGFDFTSLDESPYVRRAQFAAMMAVWQQNPFLGAGHGAVAPALIRSIEQPWAYELSYVALLFQTGAVGFSLYAAGVLWIYWQGLRIIRSASPYATVMLPTLTGLTCFLIANATNPYLAKYDYLWVIFLPVAVINCHLLEERGERLAGAAHMRMESA